MAQEEKNCLVCQRIELIKQGKNPYFIKELETSYAVLGDYQYFNGYCLLLFKEHKTELHQLDLETKTKFLQEMALLAEAVYKTFQPKKLNYELLGNTHQHLHWHIFPRYETDPAVGNPVWLIPKAERQAKQFLPNEQEKQKLIDAIRQNF